MRKKLLQYYVLFSSKESYTENDIYLFFNTKMTIFHRKVRHVSPSRDVLICLATKYLHIDIFDQNLKKVWGILSYEGGHLNLIIHC